MNVNCNIIDDLLPLYIDGSCSQETKMLVEEHLNECSSCKGKLARMKSESLAIHTQAVGTPQVVDYAKKVKRHRTHIGVLIAVGIVVAVVLLSFITIRFYLHVSARQNEAFGEYALANGPWAEQSVWVSDDGEAYLLSQNENSEKFADVTAYFYFDEAWHSFRVDMTHGNTLNFSDLETNSDQFTSDFNIKDTTLTVSSLESAEEGDTMPKENFYVFTKATNYEEAILQLPFTVS